MDFLPSVLRPNGRDRARNVEDGMSGDTLQYPPGPPPLPGSRRATLFAPEPNSQLATFRHMVGIHSTKEFAAQTANQKSHLMPDLSHNNLHFEGRAAPNLGIYNRVCHREAQAKRGYKFASVLINSCLGIQVIVAAALTAMGAANTNHVSITAFGAINTVIAGILTYLKGSGLPNRIRWYENEWKKVREYIEQRERDFSRPDCRLSVEEVVGVIEAMYEEVKADIQTNTPEMYISVSDIRARSAAATNPQIPKLHDLKGAMGDRVGRSKFEELELKYGHKVTDFLESMAHKEEERLKKIEGEVEGSKARALAALQNEKEGAIKGARDWEKDMEEKGARVAERELEHARSSVLQRGMDFAREVDAAKSGILSRGNGRERDIDTTKSSILQRGNSLSRDLDATKMAALQRGRDYEKDIEANATRVAEAERELEREAERTRIAAQRAGDSFQRTEESIQRIGKAVDDEIQPIRRD
ncbi:Nn.00g016340.m01.CDS01 [Neocucurbitaria sp. VM-36]